MTDRCDSVSTHQRTDYSSFEKACEPSAEEKAAAEASQRQGTEREAEVRRNNYYASGTDEGGRSSRASSDPGSLQTSSKYDQRDKNARLGEYTKGIDRPLEDDRAGNALVAAAGAGAIGGVKAAGAAGGDAAASVIAKAAAVAAAKALAKSARNAVGKAALDASRRGVDLPASVTAPAVAQSAAISTAEQRIPAGRSSPQGASEVVREPLQSDGQRIPEQLPQAPVRIQG